MSKKYILFSKQVSLPEHQFLFTVFITFRLLYADSHLVHIVFSLQQQGNGVIK